MTTTIWIKFKGINWRITKKKGDILYVVDNSGWREMVDISDLRIEEYTQKARDMIMRAYQ